MRKFVVNDIIYTVENDEIIVQRIIAAFFNIIKLLIKLNFIKNKPNNMNKTKI